MMNSNLLLLVTVKFYELDGSRGEEYLSTDQIRLTG